MIVEVGQTDSDGTTSCTSPTSTWSSPATSSTATRTCTSRRARSSAASDPWRAAIDTVEALEARHTDIRAWIETRNDEPKPYIWTKTADQILESIATYRTRPNESRH